MQDIHWVLEVQLKTRRTQAGRVIGQAVLPIIQNSLNNPELANADMIECRDCHIILDDEYFTDGCRNCGSKDYDMVQKPAIGA